MGFHICEFCSNKPVGANRFENTSSGDVNLTFVNGRKWVMPDMILHYVADHSWSPPQEFIDDVMSGELANSGRVQTRGINIGEVLDGGRVGYLSGSLKQGIVPESFIDRLEQLMKKAEDVGNRVQTKGVPICR